MSEPLRAPFPWFGGKSRAAPLLWEAFGDCPNYVEAFGGSLASLLARPHAPRVETVNDLDAYVANFWRALRRAPDEVAWWADRPVNEAELHATHRWLCDGESEAGRLHRANMAALQALAEGNVPLAQEVLRGAHLAGRPLGRAFRERLRQDEAYFDPEIAGRWVWGVSCWIGSGWCAQPSWEREGHGDRPTEHRKRPTLDKPGRGVHQARGEGLSHAVLWEGRGHAGGRARGVHGTRLQKPCLSGESGATGRGVCASGKAGTVREWMQRLAERLRYVRVCCGDWKRVCTPAVTEAIGVTAVLLDPPFSAEAGRDEAIYAEEDLFVAHEARAWAVANGDNPMLRIALCGYEGEHQMPPTWRCVEWKASGGYANRCRNFTNSARERIWFSPHCQAPRQASLLSLLEVSR